jgi:two-component system NtrC family sensor kinase
MVREGCAVLLSTRSKLIISLLGVSFLVGGVSLLVGGQLLYKTVLDEATTRVSLDLNAAREILLGRVKRVSATLGAASLGSEVHHALRHQDCSTLLILLKELAQQSQLDFLGVVGGDGRTLCRIGPNPVPKEPVQVGNPLAEPVLRRRVPVSGVVTLGTSFLIEENPQLADRARIKVLPTPKAAPRSEGEEISGMALAAAVPVFGGGELVGALYGGVLLNHNQEIVDTVRDTVFRKETFDGAQVGTATIFLKDLRISTNVLAADGKRAVGTQSSQEVSQTVLGEGKKWTDRAFVVNNWYITAYEPIEDISGERVGMLYVGILEEKYTEVRRKAFSVFALMTLAGVATAIGLGYLLADRIMRPVGKLIAASFQVSQGDLSPEIGPISRSELGVLQKTFMRMLTSLQERDRRQRAESEIKLLQSEKQASVGRLAAGVAHEINNPLTGVLTFTHMLLRRKDLPDDVRSDLQTIVQATERVRGIVKGLLDFSRQSKLDPEPTEMNRLVQSTVALVENQALVKGVTLDFQPRQGLPVITVDRSQIQSIIMNLIINALDATEPGGSIALSTGMAVSSRTANQRGLEIVVTDTGCGIPPENLDKLFDPFFTTKEVGHGTGLGLAVSYGIAERHGGYLRAESEVGKGSRFTVWLPVEEQDGRNGDPGRRR